MSRVTRSHTIRRHLVDGGLTDLELSEDTQKAGPGGHDVDGFSTRQARDDAGVLVVIAAAFGPDWFATMREIRHRLEQPYVRCHVDGDAPGLADNELMVRWATSAELLARKEHTARETAGVRQLLREQQARQDAETHRQALEAAGQSGLF
ncbi:hypothetical protein ACIBAC_00585 [Streptomyces sp. NPDC051362]|uniref:hypothetical protein n=1 Tax=Streptomyces sp. NPDC051362 TaxID=3365651 RepID=UPI003788DDA6